MTKTAFQSALERTLKTMTIAKRLAEQPPLSPNHSTALPFITPEMWEEFNDTCLITWDQKTGRPDWTQTAVDFCAVVEVRDYARREPFQNPINEVKE